MIINETAGTIKQFDTANRTIDFLEIEWYEASKRIQRKKTKSGQEIAIKFLKEGQRLKQDDVLYADDFKLIVADIIPCDAIVVKPKSLLEMGSVCYEIGNKHLPMFIQDDEVLLPFEDPIFKWLSASGYDTEKIFTRLTNIVNSTVQPHGHSESSSLFFKIMNIAK
ncbi:urease accessory protein UreE [Flavobacterium johnsoniae]|uniref:Urease accessory protein UreE n=1 Tax=Flavobacterium johnsoniae TaxID=986 RepID=A0A1J7BYF3_FLAJO|nr:urease accessory protein UreE [Flavobacterium johnsoniae]OIV43663.1 urease accessory protein UreE [Flavobacterium johnsoniae]